MREAKSSQDERSVITINDIQSILEQLQDMLNNSLASSNTEITITINNHNQQQMQQPNLHENKKKQIVRLTESDLHRIVESSVYSILKENIEDEGVFGNIWNGIKGVAQGAASQVGQQYQNAKANYYASQADGMNDQIAKKMEELETQKQKIQAQIDQLKAQRTSMQNKSNAAIDKANAMGQGNYGTGRQYQYKNQPPQFQPQEQPQVQPEQPQVQPEQPQVQPQTQPQQVGRMRGANGRFMRRQ